MKKQALCPKELITITFMLVLVLLLFLMMMIFSAFVAVPLLCILVFVVDGADHQQYNCVASCSVIILIDPQIVIKIVIDINLLLL